MNTGKKNIIISFGGASSSGKTTIAKLLHSLIDNSVLLHEDDFFKNDHEIPIDPTSGFANWDCPEAIDFPSFINELLHLKQTGTFSTKSSKYDSDTRDQNLGITNKDLLTSIKTQINKLITQKDLKLILVDGFMLYHDPQLISHFDIKLFLITHYGTLKARREKRAGYVTQETFWVDPPQFFEKVVYPSYAKSHGYLFKDGDVEGVVDDQIAKEQLGLNWCFNNEGSDVEEILKWAVDVIMGELKKF